MPKLEVWLRFKRLARSFLGAVGVQAVSQVLGFTSSILIIRWAAPAEYALYIIGLSLQGALAAISDSGISANVMAQGGRVWNNKDSLGRVLAAGELLRRRIGFICAAVTIPLGFFFLVQNAADTLSAILIVGAVVFSFWAYLPSGILEVPLKLHQDFAPIFKLRLSATVLRVVLLVGIAFVQPLAWLLVGAAGLVQAFFNLLLRRLAAKYADPGARASEESLSELRGVVSRSLPGAVYYSVQAQLSLWLLASFGVGQSVADLGALGRLAAAATLITVAFDTVVVPQFSKLRHDRLPKMMGALILMSTMILGAAAYLCILATGAILDVLGEQYSHLASEFAFLCFATAASLIASFVWSINSARAYIPPWFLYPVAGTAFFLCFSAYFGVSTPLAAIKTQLCIGLASLIINLAVMIYYWRIEGRHVIAGV